MIGRSIDIIKSAFQHMGPDFSASGAQNAGNVSSKARYLPEGAQFLQVVADQFGGVSVDEANLGTKFANVAMPGQVAQVFQKPVDSDQVEFSAYSTGLDGAPENADGRDVRRPGKALIASNTVSRDLLENGQVDAVLTFQANGTTVTVYDNGKVITE